jgi:hypothetical protein
MPSGSREEVSSHAPCPFWATPLPHVGLFHITTIRKCVRVPTHAPLCSAEFAGGVSVTAFHARFIALRVSRRHGACASPRHLGERNDTSTAPKLSKTLRSRPFIPDTSGHFEGTDRSFALYTAFPCSLDGRDAVDYYEDSVTIGLAPRRRSRVPFGPERLEHDVGVPLIPLNRFAIDRLSGEGYGAQKSNAPILTASPVDAVARSVRFHRWRLGCRQSRFRPLRRALQDGAISVFWPRPLFRHALVPSGFRL